MKERVLAAILVLGLIMPALFLGCADEKKPSSPNPPPPPPENAFVGSAACGSQSACHQHDDIVQKVQSTGHPHILTPVNGEKPGAPLTLPDQPPAGLSWSDIHYVVGGFGWKALFVNQQNQIVTGNDAVYDLLVPPFSQAAFSDTTLADPAYDDACFRCHTTGPDQATQSFHEAGVQCEACHGMGKFHTQSADPSDIHVDRTAAACGSCHALEAGGARVIAAGGFIRSEQQYSEFHNSPHGEDQQNPDMTCATCHTPHVGVRNGQVGGIAKTCESAGCHASMEVNHPVQTCTACHMARATKSARSLNRYVADVRTHLFKIHDGPEGQAEMFETDGSGTHVKAGYGVTLDFACYSCHKDTTGVGGPRSQQSLAELYAKAQQIHEAGLSARGLTAR